MSDKPHSNIGTIVFAMGFVLMMKLDVALGYVFYYAFIGIIFMDGMCIEYLFV